MKYELLIFDWDGTLADSAGQIVSAMQGAIDGLGLPPRSDESIRELIGLGLNDALARLYPELELSGLRALLDSYRAKWLSEGAGEARLFDGAFEAVPDLHRQGCRIVIATGKSRRGLDRSLRHHERLSQTGSPATDSITAAAPARCSRPGSCTPQATPSPCMPMDCAIAMSYSVSPIISARSTATPSSASSSRSISGLGLEAVSSAQREFATSSASRW